ncbi:hypothetical protein KIW84_012081 [Lathyrus oleraceus]|uniref:Leucine-rich repeat and WD repeat-containing protein 1 n=1 Tax=Pisum sativum TaxID=3888 RepID=A0A9D5BGR1_PEA|nr:hypothetical protein KIW84_012081 [Pisum sativum]
MSRSSDNLCALGLRKKDAFINVSYDQIGETQEKESSMKKLKIFIEDWVSSLQQCAPPLEDITELPEPVHPIVDVNTEIAVTPSVVDHKISPGMEVAKRYISSLTANASAAQLANHGWVVIPFLSAFVSLKVLNLSGNGIVKITADLSFNRILRNADFNNPANVICSLSFDRDEDYFASAGISKKIKIFDFNTLCNDSVDIHYPTVEMSNRSKLRSVCWNNYIKNYLTSTNYDGVVKLWDASTGQEFSQYSEHEKRAWSVDFSPVCPTKFASGSDDCTVKLWSITFGSANYSTYCYDLRNLRGPWCVLVGHRKAFAAASVSAVVDVHAVSYYCYGYDAAADDDVSTTLHVVCSSSSLSGAASLTLTVSRLQHKSTREPARTAYCKELNSLSKAGLPPLFNVLLVCYSLFERHNPQQKDDRKILKRWKWSCVLMDEAHALKDKNSFRWKNLMSVARNAIQRLMLEGTPLQNDLHELWSMLEFMMPDVFASEDVDLKKLLSAEDTDLISRMKSILEPFILRRLKSDVMQQLIQKTQKVEYVMMVEQQEHAYREAIEEYRTVSQARLTKCSDLNS